MPDDEETPKEPTPIADGALLQPDGSVKILGPRAYGELRGKAEEKGRREAMKEIEAAAKKAGFGSIEDAFGAVAQMRQAPQPAPTTPIPPAAPTIDVEKVIAAERAKWDREQARLRKQQEDQFKQQQLALDQQKAELEFTAAAYRHGIKSEDAADFALLSFKRANKNKTAEELATLDEKAFFDQFKKDHPYLYGEPVVVNKPADTSVTAAPLGAQIPQIPPQQGAGQGNGAPHTNPNGLVDARQMDDAQFRNHLASLGLSAPH